MKPDRWKRLEPLLDELLDLPREERAARLDAISGGDAELREDLERLLRADHTKAAGPLDGDIRSLANPLFEGEAEEPASTPAGRRIGPYRVLGVLGRGGMGEVLLAERADGDFEQRVALKLVPGDVVRPAQAERLRHERQILARLRHPNIASLYDGGVTETGAPFFAMEVVDGVPLDEFCEREALSPAERVRLFDAVCRAVHFAHRNLVIHRDLKPSNVLVTGDGTVKLLDFGIAKIVEEGDDATRTQQRFLTPAFAAPEQLRGDPTSTATDVYALGVLLHLLVTGRRPADSEPASPADATLGDLRLVLDKALREDADDRYASVEELRLDLERYLASMPVSARPQTTGYKLRKFVRRNRLAVGVATAALVAVLGFSGWISWLYARSERHLARAVQAEAESVREAETQRRVSEFLTELFEVASPAVSLGEDVSARDILDAGAARIEEELDTEPHVRASLQLTMAASYRWLGEFEEGLRLAESAAENRRKLFGEGSVEHAHARAEVGWQQLRLGRLEEAAETNREVIRILERSLSPNDPDLAEAWSALGGTLFDRGEFDECEQAMAKALEIREAGDPRIPAAVALASNDLAALYVNAGRIEDAARLFGHAIEVHEAAGDTLHPALASYYANRSDALSRLGRLQEAEPLVRKALELAHATMGEDNPEAAEQDNTAGLFYQRLQEWEESERHFLRAIDVFETKLGPDHPKTIWTLDNLAAMLIEAGRLDEADPLCERVVATSAVAIGEDNIYHGAVLLTQAELREAQGRWREAGELREQALPLYEATFGSEHATYANRLVELAENHRRQGRAARAAELLEQALAVYEATKGPDDEVTRRTREKLAAAGNG